MICIFRRSEKEYCTTCMNEALNNQEREKKKTARKQTRKRKKEERNNEGQKWRKNKQISSFIGNPANVMKTGKKIYVVDRINEILNERPYLRFFFAVHFLHNSYFSFCFINRCNIVVLEKIHTLVLPQLMRLFIFNSYVLFLNLCSLLWCNQAYV